MLYIKIISNPWKQDASKPFKVDLAEPDDNMIHDDILNHTTKKWLMFPTFKPVQHINNRANGMELILFNFIQHKDED